jgi:hypothetical protein
MKILTLTYWVSMYLHRKITICCNNNEFRMEYTRQRVCERRDTLKMLAPKPQRTISFETCVYMGHRNNLFRGRRLVAGHCEHCNISLGFSSAAYLGQLRLKTITFTTTLPFEGLHELAIRTKLRRSILSRNYNQPVRTKVTRCRSSGG